MGRSWAVLGRHLGRKNAPNRYKTYGFVHNHFFEDKTIQRGFNDQLGPTKGQNEPNMTPKRDPRWSPKRSKIDVQIDMNFDAKTKRARQPTTLRLWAGTPPRELRGGAPGAQGRRPRHHGTALPGTQAPMHAFYTYINIHLSKMEL